MCIYSTSARLYVHRCTRGKNGDIAERGALLTMCTIVMRTIKETPLYFDRVFAKTHNSLFLSRDTEIDQHHVWIGSVGGDRREVKRTYTSHTSNLA